jgi:hypothetical protein
MVTLWVPVFVTATELVLVVLTVTVPKLMLLGLAAIWWVLLPAQLIANNIASTRTVVFSFLSRRLVFIHFSINAKFAGLSDLRGAF